MSRIDLIKLSRLISRIFGNPYLQSCPREEDNEWYSVSHPASSLMASVWWNSHGSHRKEVGDVLSTTFFVLVPAEQYFRLNHFVQAFGYVHRIVVIPSYYINFIKPSLKKLYSIKSTFLKVVNRFARKWFLGSYYTLYTRH